MSWGGHSVEYHSSLITACQLRRKAQNIVQPVPDAFQFITLNLPQILVLEWTIISKILLVWGFRLEAKVTD